ncbi:hypothetical protein K2Y00_01950 [Patescibacteria group bacterium]|nr:hypothetical protein [Patescibacteria group bacterium]
MIYSSTHRGFTLLIAIILSSVILSLALALLDVAYKQIVLASTAKHSQYAFYAADGALECILYYDQKYDAFGTNPYGYDTISCNSQVIPFTSSGSSPKFTEITIPCAEGGDSEQARVEIYKGYDEAPPTRIYANGYSSCNPDDSRRLERGVRVVY